MKKKDWQMMKECGRNGSNNKVAKIIAFFPQKSKFLWQYTFPMAHNSVSGPLNNFINLAIIIIVNYCFQETCNCFFFHHISIICYTPNFNDDISSSKCVNKLISIDYNCNYSFQFPSRFIYFLGILWMYPCEMKQTEN